MSSANSRDSLESNDLNSNEIGDTDLLAIVNKLFSAYEVREALNIKPYSISSNDFSKGKTQNFLVGKS